jgi:hypothetical protein
VRQEEESLAPSEPWYWPVTQAVGAVTPDAQWWPLGQSPNWQNFLMKAASAPPHPVIHIDTEEALVGSSYVSAALKLLAGVAEKDDSLQM